jgi:hypothetical protein
VGGGPPSPIAVATSHHRRSSSRRVVREAHCSGSSPPSSHRHPSHLIHPPSTVGANVDWLIVIFLTQLFKKAKPKAQLSCSDDAIRHDAWAVIEGDPSLPNQSPSMVNGVAPSPPHRPLIMWTISSRPSGPQKCEPVDCYIFDPALCQVRV